MSQRKAFTLIEVLVVIAIIAVLVGMIFPGVQAVRESARRARASSEINQLSVAISSAKDTMSAKYIPNYAYVWSSFDVTPHNPPVTTNLNYDFNSAALNNLRQFFGSRFGIPDQNNPYIIRTNLPNWGAINGGQCLVFFLGGYRDGQYTIGFGDDTTNPFYTPSVAQNPQFKPNHFFDFQTKRLWFTPTGGPPMFADQWSSSSQTPTPYFYFTSQRGGDYEDQSRQLNKPGLCTYPAGMYRNFDTNQTIQINNSLTMIPLKDVTGKFVNMNGFQIVSAGKNGIAGPGGMWRPGVSPYAINDPGWDDYSSFKTGGLGQQE